MFYLFLCFATAFFVNSANGYCRLHRSKIVGGEDTDISKVPYQLGMLIQETYNRWYCGAVLISEMSALTAAHCISKDTLSIQLSAGRNTLSNYDIDVAKFVVHPEYIYKARNRINDIAYLELVSPLTFTDKIQPAKLPSGPPVVGSSAVVSGWGRLKYQGPLAVTLQSVVVQIIDLEECEKKYQNMGYVLTDGMVCAGVPEGGKDSCQGDSGGPLVVDGELVGIVSWGEGCASPLYPGVYTNVFYYLDWIKEQNRHCLEYGLV